MDARTHERQGAGLHGLVTTRRAATLLFAGCAAASLVAGVAGGLLRAGIPAGSGDWAARAALAHAALMMGGFLGTVIGIERAVAARRAFAWAAPVLSASAGLLLLAGQPAPASHALVAAATVFAGVNVLLWLRQPASHTALLVAGGCAWWAGNFLLAAGASGDAVLPWWFAFLLLTIAAERLEMTRLMRRRPGAQPALQAIVALLAAGAALCAFSPAAGGALFGGALAALSAWLFAFDIARRTVRSTGLPRYMAACLLGGYAWLALGGAAWAAMALGLDTRDAALHAVGLGMVFSMILGHAPVILPAVARVKLRFGPHFYAPLVLLHASLALRLAPGWRSEGALLNAAALAAFALTVIGSALAWRRRAA